MQCGAKKIYTTLIREKVLKYLRKRINMAKKVQKTKKKSFLPKWVRSRWFVFFGSLFFIVLGAFFLLCIDKYNAYRPPELDIAFFNEWLPKAFGLEGKSNVTMFSWFIFFCGFGVLLLFAISFIFYKYGLDLREKTWMDVYKEPYPTKKHVLYTIVFFTGVLLIEVLYVFAFMLLFTSSKGNIFDYLSKNPDAKTELKNLGTAIGLLFISIMIVPTALAIVVFLLWLIIKFISFIVGGVTNTVVASASYQEAATATQIVQERIKREIGATSFSDLGTAARVAVQNKKIDELFPGLAYLDNKHEGIIKEKPVTENVDLAKFKTFTKRFQAYLANRFELYYEERILRAFIAGMAASRLVFLEGLSGTGKTTLPRMFMRFMGGEANFYPVQASWRDKTDVLGFFSDLTASYKETELLYKLYEAGYTPNQITLMVLDEMNISRPEYYFADFLSVFEYPSDEWKIKIYQPETNQKMPQLLEDGYVRINKNIWFIGTLNVDDSTFTLSDKIYDRAISIDFEEANIPFTSKYDDSEFPMTCSELEAYFKACQANKSFCLDKAEQDKFYKMCDFVCETFEVKFGNRIIKQINDFLPVYVALGGTKIEALDHMFASKILRKLDSKYESFMYAALNELLKYVQKFYGKGVLKQSEKVIKRYQRRFN